MSNLQRLTNKSYQIEKWLRKKGYRPSTRFVSKVTASFLNSKGFSYQMFNPRYKGLFTANIYNAPKTIEHFEEFKKIRFKRIPIKINMRKEEIYRAAEEYVGYKSGYYTTEQLQSINDFKAGAEWATERSYSEEEVLALLQKFNLNAMEYIEKDNVSQVALVATLTDKLD